MLRAARPLRYHRRMRWTSCIALAATVAACGGTTAAAPTTTATAAAETTSPTDEAPAAPSAPWLAALTPAAMLTYRVTASDGTSDVRMQVQERVERGGSVAVRLAAIGTPLADAPVYAQWLIGSADALQALEEHAAFTEPGFVPIDGSGRVLTEAASHESWRVEARWLRADRLASGREASAGWTLLERVPSVEAPLHAERCARLEQREGAVRLVQLVCADTGVVELVRMDGEAVRERWELVSIGVRPEELE